MPLNYDRLNLKKLDRFVVSLKGDNMGYIQRVKLMAALKKVSAQVDDIEKLHSLVKYPYMHISARNTQPTINTKTKMKDPWGIYFLPKKKNDTGYGAYEEPDHNYMWFADIEPSKILHLNHVSYTEILGFFQKAGFNYSDKDEFFNLLSNAEKYNDAMLGDNDLDRDATDEEIKEVITTYWFAFLRVFFNSADKFRRFFLSDYNALYDNGTAGYAGQRQFIVLNPSIIEWGPCIAYNTPLGKQIYKKWFK